MRFCKVFPANSEPQRWGCVKLEVACTSWCFLQVVWFSSSLGIPNNISIWSVQHWILKPQVSGSSCSDQYYSPRAALLKRKIISPVFSALPISPLFPGRAPVTPASSLWSSRQSSSSGLQSQHLWQKMRNSTYLCSMWVSFGRILGKISFLFYLHLM